MRAGRGTMAKGGIGGTKDRKERLEQRKSGQWSTVSSDLLYLVSRLYKLSEKEADTSPGKRSSKMVFAGIPLLLSSLSSLIIECENIGTVTPAALDMSQPLPKLLSERYLMSGKLLKDFECLCEIRNEIVHPVPLPTGTNDNWPNYLRRVKDKRVAIEHPEPDTHYTFFAQMASHDLFAWAVVITREAYKTVIHSYPGQGGLFQLFLTTFANFAPAAHGSSSVER
jgi:hypothetical protein